MMRSKASAWGHRLDVVGLEQGHIEVLVEDKSWRRGGDAAMRVARLTVPGLDMVVGGIIGFAGWRHGLDKGVDDTELVKELMVAKDGSEVVGDIDACLHGWLQGKRGGGLAMWLQQASVVGRRRSV